MAYRLARLFWWEVLQINPAQTDLRLDAATATRWRERLAVTTDGRPRREIHSTLFVVRALYRDLAEWAHDEPARWGPWVAPCPVPRRESKQASKVRRQQKARTQDRTRALTPLLPAMVAETARRRDWSQRLLASTLEAGHNETFTVDGSTFRRIVNPPPRRERDRTSELRVRLLAPNPDPDVPPIRLQYGLVNVTKAESITQLSLRHYTSETTGTLVPLLHIVPSKNDAERLIPMSPELVNVLLEVDHEAAGHE